MNNFEQELTVMQLLKKGNQLMVVLSNGKQEKLNPESLDSNKQGRVSCLVSKTNNPVLFGNTARLELQRLFKEHSGFWGLSIAGSFYPVMAADPKLIPIKARTIVFNGAKQKNKKVTDQKKVKAKPVIKKNPSSQKPIKKKANLKKSGQLKKKKR